MAGQPALLVAVLLATGVAPITDAAMREETGRLATQLGALRRIPLRGPLDRQLVTREEARAEIARSVTAALTGSDMATEERVLQRLGLLPAGSDYIELLTQSLNETPASSYDPASRRLYVADWVPLERQRAALAHEIAHALADQRFGLRRTLQISPDGGHRLDRDAERAREALIEGDANTAALELDDARGVFLGAHELPALAERLRATATGNGRWQPWIRAVSLFTHVDGLLFVARVRARETWSGVDALWLDPPQTTEQVLHPEKYEARELGVRIDPAPLGALEPGFRLGGGAVLGELGVRTWLATAVAPEVAARAAAGWGGDRAVLFVPPAERPVDAAAAPPSEPVLAWLTLWDDPLEAEDFARAACAALARLAGSPRVPALDEAGRAVARSGEQLYALGWRRDAVALLLGAPEGSESALAEMLEGWQRLPPTAPVSRDARRPHGDRERSPGRR